MKLKLAVCDDDAAQRDYLTDIVTAWGKKNRHLIELKQYVSADSFLFDYEEEKDFDILLLDVEMPGKSGVELAKEIRKDNQAVQLIFITGFYEYFSDGFDVSALHYLIKPADAAKLTPVKLITRTDVTMTNGAVVPLSRGVYHDIHAALVKYL